MCTCKIFFDIGTAALKNIIAQSFTKVVTENKVPAIENNTIALNFICNQDFVSS